MQIIQITDAKGNGKLQVKLFRSIYLDPTWEQETVDTAVEDFRMAIVTAILNLRHSIEHPLLK